MLANVSNETLVLEGFDGASHDSEHVSESGNYWLKPDILRFSERYLNSESCVILYLRDRHGVEFAAVFQKCGRDVRRAEHADGKTSGKCIFQDSADPLPIAPREAMPGQTNPCGDDECVLVSVIYLCQIVDCPSVPSSVWLNSIDCLDSILPRASYFSQFLGVILLGRRKGWEIRKPDLIRPRANFDQMCSEMVESASHILDSVSNDCGKRQWDILEKMDAPSSLSRLRIVLGRDFIWVGGFEGEDFPFEVTDVLFGPIDLY